MPAAVPFIIQAVVTVVVTAVVSKLLAPSSPASKNPASAETGGRVQLSPATNNKLPVCYGQSWASPIVVDGKISSDNQYMWYVMAFSETTDSGTIYFDDSNGGGLPVMYWGDNLLTFNPTVKYQVQSMKADNDPESARVTFTADEFNVYFYNDGSYGGLYGAPTATHILSDATTGGGIPADQRWTENDVMYKTAFCVVRMKYNSDKNITNIQQATVKLTNTLTSPGAVMYDYFTNNRYGCGIPASMIDKTTFDSLDSYSQQTINFTNNTGTSATQARYKINGPVDTTKDNYNNIQELCKSCDSWLQWNETTAKWGVIANKSYTSAGLTFDNLFHVNDSNIIGAVQIIPSNLDSAYTKAEVQFPSKLIKDQFDTAYIDKQNVVNGKTTWTANQPDMRYTNKYEMVNDSVQAQYLATRKILQSLEDLSIEFSMDYSGIQLDAGDVIRVTHGWYEWDQKLFRVMRVDEILDQEGKLFVTISANEYNDTIYADGALVEFNASPNTGMANPNIIGAPSTPTITSVNSTGSVPSFQVNCSSPSTGRVVGLEFWYSTSATSDISGNNYLLKETQHYSSGSVYPSNTGESIVVSGFKSGNYWWRVRAVGTNSKSSFSDAVYISWNPNPTATVVGQTFQAVFAPNYLSVPRTGDVTLSPVFTGITPSVVGLIGGGSVTYSNSSTDSAMPSNSWRIGSSSTTGGFSSIIYSNISFPTPTAGTSSVNFGEPTAMSASPAYITVPIRYKDSSGTVSQSASAQIQLAFLDPGTKGNNGINGVTYISPTVYFNAVIGQTVTITGGTWELSTGRWTTRPVTTANGVVVTNTDTPSSITSGSYRYVARANPQVANASTASLSTTWSTPAIDGGFGPAGKDGNSPVDISISGGGGFYRNSSGVYSPSTMTFNVIIQNYDTPVPNPQWTVVGATPNTFAGSTLTITPTSTTNIQITCQVGAYTKSITVPVVSQGAQGKDGAAGAQGAQGVRGFTPLAYIPYNGDPRTATTSQLNTAWQSILGYQPINGDGAAFYGADSNGDKVTRTSRYNGSWVDADMFIPGDLIVEKSISSAAINADDIFAMNISSTSVATTGSFGDFLVDSGFVLRDIGAVGTYTLTIAGSCGLFQPGDKIYLYNDITHPSYTVEKVAIPHFSYTTITLTSKLLYDYSVGTIVRTRPSGYWMRGSDGSANFSGIVSIGQNLYVDGLVNNGVLQDGVVTARSMSSSITAPTVLPSNADIVTSSTVSVGTGNYSHILYRNDGVFPATGEGWSTYIGTQRFFGYKVLGYIDLTTPDWWRNQPVPNSTEYLGNDGVSYGAPTIRLPDGSYVQSWYIVADDGISYLPWRTAYQIDLNPPSYRIDLRLEYLSSFTADSTNNLAFEYGVAMVNEQMSFDTTSYNLFKTYRSGSGSYSHITRLGVDTTPASSVRSYSGSLYTPQRSDKNFLGWYEKKTVDVDGVATEVYARTKKIRFVVYGGFSTKQDISTGPTGCSATISKINISMSRAL